MIEYPKIYTVYKRDPTDRYKTLLMHEFAKPEFEFLADNTWSFVEKLNGTNVRIGLDADELIIDGRNDDAQMHVFLYRKLARIFSPEALDKQFGTDNFVIFGEGYGAKVVPGSGNYNPKSQGFCLFDVWVDGWWLKRDAIEEIAGNLGLEIAPIIGTGTLHDMVLMAQGGFKSQWGDFQAEGIVARPLVDLFARNGDRVITKIKCKDFR